MKKCIHANQLTNTIRPVFSIGFVLIAYLYSILAKAQCPVGCNVTITPSSNMGTALTISNTQYCFNAAAGDIVYTGTINLQAGGTIVICGGNSNTVYFKNSFIEGGNGARSILVNGNLVMDNTGTTVGITRSDVTVNGSMTIMGKGSPVTVGFTGGSLTVNEGAKTVLDATTSNLSGASYTIAGTLQLTGNLTTSTSSVFSNKGTLVIAGDAAFSGIYNNHGVWRIGGTLTLNTTSGSDMTGGIFYSNNLVLNGTHITASTGNCSAFVVTNNSKIASSNFLATGDIVLLDLSNPGSIDFVNATCAGGKSPPFNAGPYCGITPVSSLNDSECLSVLPLSWVSFNGIRLNDNHVKLNWITADEYNVASFTIQRSEDGVNFIDLYIMEGTGNSQGNKSYAYTDYTALGKSYYYRIMEMDNTNYSSYSNLIIVNSKIVDADLLIYPNPVSFGASFTIVVKGLTQNVGITIQLMDIRGNIIYSNENYESQGFVELSLNEIKLPKGFYIIATKTNQKVITQKLIVQ